ncbi:YhjD/YihY/BrkB family envelope integrity protein [Streptomyces sp. NPDC002265]|uniref:YihY/virulence factor BrkB family protein n=1 Tax=Streptomyces sp. NPDC002265 TaxID=3154415 RepID=UPI00331EE8AF
MTIATEDRTAEINRERVTRTLTFWLRPSFALRVVNRFQKIVGFDRAMALASSALTAIIPLAILTSAVLNSATDYDAAERIISRYGLTGAGATSVRSLFTPAEDDISSTGVFGVVFLTISALSFARASQRLFEQTWQLKPLSVRNTRYGLGWILSLGAYMAVTGWLHAALGGGRLELTAAVFEVPLTAAFLLWSGRLLSAKRIGWADLLPFAITAAVLTAVYSVGAAVYLPRLFNSYASRYGSIGAVFAMISALFTAMLVIVGSAAVGREVSDELDRIKHGHRPSDNEVRRQWDLVVEQARSRWHTAREQVSRRRSKGPEKDPGKGPENGPAKDPEKGPGQGPAKDPGKGPENS